MGCLIRNRRNTTEKESKNGKEEQNESILVNKKIGYGGTLVVGVIVGLFVGMAVGGFALASVVGPPSDDMEPINCDGSDCVKFADNAGFNVQLHFYDGGDKIHETGGLSGTGIVRLIEGGDLSDADEIDVEADAWGPCGGTYETFEGISSGDYPLKISAGGTICIGKDADLNAEYTGDT